MSYRIIYGPEPAAARREKRGYLRLQMMTVSFFVLFVILVKLFWPEGNAKLQEFLLPGEPAVTQQALEEMIADFHSGAEVGEAFAAFCRQIIDDEKPAE